MTCLVVTVDTEEEGLWGGVYRPTGNTVENIQHVPKFQQICDEYGIRPTYLVDAPVVESPAAVSVLKAIQDRGACEIGTHVHPWCNPPRSIEDNRQTYLCNLPREVQYEKINWLTQTIEERFGTRPVSFRAGRYGLDGVGFRILEELGYRVDSSVIPFSNYSAKGGPDFSAAPVEPYFPIIDDLCISGKQRSTLEVPVTVGYSRGQFEAGYRLQQRLDTPLGRALHFEGVLNRLGFLNRIKLCPEQSTAEEMCLLLDRCIERQLPAAVLMFHSSSLMPGASPYTRDELALQAFLIRIRQLLNYAIHVRHLRVHTLKDFSSEFAVKLPHANCVDHGGRK